MFGWFRRRRRRKLLSTPLPEAWPAYLAPFPVFETLDEAEFERNIQNLAFTYNEAVDRVRGELKTFVGALLNSFLPEMTSDLLREHVRAELLKLADELIDVPIEIVTSPDCAGLIGEMLQSDFSLKVELAEDESLAPSQVFVRVAEREVEVNLAPLLGALKDQFEAVSKPEKGINVHG